jgi:DNA-binding GntR family transcriptional regulator
LSGLAPISIACHGLGDVSSDTHYPINLEFHASLLAFTGNDRLAAEYSGFVLELHLFRRRALVSPSRMEASNAEHAGIIDVLATHHADLARSLMVAHVSVSF